MALPAIPVVPDALQPDQVVSTVVRGAGNVAHTVLYGGLADLRPMPRTLIDSGELREVHHYRPMAVRESGDPVLLVTPLAAPSLCWDLRRGCSLAEHLVTTGRPTYVVEYGQISFRNRSLGIEHWIDEVVPAAIRAASAHAGGRPVHLVGWSLGGLFSLLVAADAQDLPIASVSVLATPVDTRLVPMVAPLRPLLKLAGGGVVDRAYRLLGGAPKPFVRWAFQMTSFQKFVTKPVAIAAHLDDTEWLAQIEAVDHFTANMNAYPGRSFGQLYHRFVRSNELRRGTLELGGRTLDLADVTVPVAVYAGANDGIAPVAAVKALVGLLRGAETVEFEIVPGGHLGMLTGRAARATTWRSLDDWFERFSGRQAPARKAAAKKAATKKTAAKKTAAKKTAAKKTATKKTAAKKTATTRTAAKKSARSSTRTAAKKTTATKAPAKKTATKKTAAKKTSARGSSATSGDIGSNPTRRYGSDASRRLSG
ncbi:alpha/beta fold hydrolase [uncultured Nocardioides sp.]|uniref:alpha/beta fold hydrolase n=1 Tax=uncultured Nocardioides sp. TaxID=198441 RepID=UPI0026339697|nr:alpha/beta fold hydrolase [uncultured Nocardioides sp.]